MYVQYAAIQRNSGDFMSKLLVIEDDHETAKLLESIFVYEKYSVICAGTAAEGFQSCLSELPDLVLMGIRLPDGSGIDLCRMMKGTPQIKHIPVILLTTDSTTAEDRMRGLEADAEGYMSKPFVNEELIARVAGVLKRSPGQTGAMP